MPPPAPPKSSRVGNQPPCVLSSNPAIFHYSSFYSAISFHFQQDLFFYFFLHFSPLFILTLHPHLPSSPSILTLSFFSLSSPPILTSHLHPPSLLRDSSPIFDGREPEGGHHGRKEHTRLVQALQPCL